MLVQGTQPKLRYHVPVLSKYGVGSSNSFPVQRYSQMFSRSNREEDARGMWEPGGKKRLKLFPELRRLVAKIPLALPPQREVSFMAHACLLVRSNAEG